MKVSTSFLSRKKIKGILEELNLTDTDYIHVDVVDGKFATGMNVRPKRVYKKIYKYTSKRLDVHLMVKKPKDYIKIFAKQNTEYITIHLEIDGRIDKYIELIKSYGMKAGLAINPATDISSLKPFLEDIDLVLVMAATPGEAGQPLSEETPEKVKKLKNLIKKNKLKIAISVDCGVNDENVKILEEAGMDIAIVDSFVNKNEDKQMGIDKLRGTYKEKEEEVEEETEDEG